MTNRLLLFVLPFISILTLACHTSTSPRPWHLQLPTDTTWHFVAQSILIPDVNNSRTDTMTVFFNLRFLEERDSVLTLQLRIEELKRSAYHFAVILPGKTAVEMDKMNREWEAFKDSCRQGVVEDSLVIKCSSRGELVTVNGVEKILQKIAMTTGHDSRDVYSSLQDMFSTRAMEDLMKQLLFYLRGRPVLVGENWVNNYTLNAKAPVKYSNLITVQQLQGDTVLLHTKTAVSAWTGEGGRIFAKGDQWGTVKASLATGMPWLISMEDSLVTKTDYYSVTARHVFTVRARREYR
jgi:hypothetical protein